MPVIVALAVLLFVIPCAVQVASEYGAVERGLRLDAERARLRRLLDDASQVVVAHLAEGGGAAGFELLLPDPDYRVVALTRTEPLIDGERTLIRIDLAVVPRTAGAAPAAIALAGTFSFDPLTGMFSSLHTYVPPGGER